VFASNHVQNGASLNVLQELGGWKTTEMVQRYAHLSPNNLAAVAENSLPSGHVLVTDALEDKNKATA